MTWCTASLVSLAAAVLLGEEKRVSGWVVAEGVGLGGSLTGERGLKGVPSDLERLLGVCVST